MSHLASFSAKATVFILGLAVLSGASKASTITVDFPGDRSLVLGQGESPRGNCSLREALNNSDNKANLPTNACNAGSGDDIIVFAPGLSEVKLETAQFGVLSVKSNAKLLVEGHGPGDKVAINGANKGGILDIDNSDASVSFTDVRFVAGRRDGGGGAILQKGGTLILRGCRFDANSATSGGALAVTGLDSRVFIYDCVFWSNTATGHLGSTFDGTGGAIWFAGGEALITRTAFAENYARLAGGAIDCDSAGSMGIHGSLVENDNATDNNSIFQGNSTLLENVDFAGAAGGGAISAECELVVTDTRFENNDSYGKGGAVYVGSGSIGAYFNRVAFENNRAVTRGGGVGGLGGAAAVEGSATFNRVSASFNRANRGGAFYMRGLSGVRHATVENSTLFANTAVDRDGAGIWFGGPLQEFGVVIVNTTLDENDGGAQGSSLYFDSNINQPVTFENNILQATNGTANCAGTVDAGTLDTGIGTHSIQFDLSIADTCANGVAGQAMPKLDANFLVHGIRASAFPNVRYSSINDYSNAASVSPGASGILCYTVGVAKPPGWVAAQFGTDQIGKRRDAAHCSRGAVEAHNVVILDF